MKATVHTKKALLALLVPALMMQQSLAQTTEDQEPTVALEALEGTISSQPQEQVGEQVLTRRTLDEQMVQNSHDLVRYNTEVDVAEIGRYGNKGFAIRGVDGNRINMNIDGVALPESEANEIFSPYGYMYEGRFNPDVEIMNSVRIHAGADSLISGSGAVGGSVTYNTKRPTDLIKGDKNWGGYAKVGYTQKNEEWLTAAGLALANNKVEAIINYAHRDGRETKNHDMRRSDKARLDPSYVFSAEDMPSPYDTHSLIYPNPLHYKRDSALAKLYYYINDQHRIGVNGMYQKQTNHMNVESTNTFGGRTGSTTRRAHDKEEMKSYGLNYQYLSPSSSWLDGVDVSYAYSDVLGLADTWVYDRNLDWKTEELKSIKLSQQEYRPTQTKTNQATVAIKSLPFDFNRLGNHQFELRGNYTKQDYTISATYLGHSSTPTHLSFAFPDAKKTIYNATLIDSIRLNDKLSAILGVRYDNYRYAPYYQDNINGLSEHQKNADICKNSSNNSSFCQLYRKGQGLSDSKFNHLTWSGLFNYELIKDKVNVNYKIGTGFLAPTVTQIYSNFEGLGAKQIPNYNLKPETSLNQELEFDWKVQDNINLTLGGYYTKYDDFIHTKYWQGSRDNPNSQGCITGTCLQSINLDEAKVYGLKLGVRADLSDYLNSKGKFNVFADFHTAKDSATIETDNNGKLKVNTLAAVPTSLLLGGTYNSPDDRWSLNARINWIKRKKPQDTKFIDTQLNYTQKKVYCKDSYYVGYCSYGGFNTYDSAAKDYYKIDRAVDGYNEFISTYDQTHRSKDVMLFDVFGSAKLGKNKNWIVNAGVYNITNVKYIPWETLRQFVGINTNNSVDKDGHGFNRYTAPGRNYAVSLTYEF